MDYECRRIEYVVAGKGNVRIVTSAMDENSFLGLRHCLDMDIDLVDKDLISYLIYDAKRILVSLGEDDTEFKLVDFS